MKADTSFKDYADYYDLIYKDKDYRKEVDFIENIFEFEDTHKPKKILEVGCGTGSYTKILLERGYEVTAVDISGNMLEIAGEKCACKFIKGDVRDITINEKHVVRFYFPQEIKYYLENAGFEVLKICPFLDLNGPVDENVWNMCVIARAGGGER